ncbi:MAG: glycosyltransferase family 4 protein [Microscillaceae bacterium]
MRVAIVLNTSWNIYNFRQGLVKSILAEGHQVIAIAPRDNYSEHLIAMGCEYYPVKLENKGSNPLRDLGYMHQLYRIYKKVNPDVVLQFTIKPNIYGTLAAFPLRKLVVNNVCGLGTVFLHDTLTAKIARMLYKFSFRLPKRVFFQNEDDRNLFLERRLIRVKATDLVPGSGIPLHRFMPRPFQRNQPFTFLMVARLLYDKGVREYIEAIRICQAQGIQARFCLLGALEADKRLGIPQALLQQWIAEGLIEYLGTTDDVSSVLDKADCVVLPSYREGTPRALLEAASMAKPLITTDIAGCRQTVEDGHNGFLCEVKNGPDLAQKMLAMYQLDDETLKKMGDASRKKVEAEFDEQIVIEKYLSILRSYEVLKRRKVGKVRPKNTQLMPI